MSFCFDVSITPLTVVISNIFLTGKRKVDLFDFSFFELFPSKDISYRLVSTIRHLDP